jgi:hypothetical protein
MWTWLLNRASSCGGGPYLNALKPRIRERKELLDPQIQTKVWLWLAWISLSLLFFGFFIRLFICAYIVWAISPPCPPCLDLLLINEQNATVTCWCIFFVLCCFDLVVFGFLYFTGSSYIAQAALESQSSCFHLLNAGLIGLEHHDQPVLGCFMG